MFTGYILWHYGPALRRVMAIAGNFIAFSEHLFSMRELLVSLFAPWKRITDDVAGGLFSAQMFWAVWDNLLSRILGAIARSILLALGIIFFVFVVLASVLFVLIWFVGPVLPIALFFLGIAMF